MEAKLVFLSGHVTPDASVGRGRLPHGLLRFQRDHRATVVRQVIRVALENKVPNVSQSMLIDQGTLSIYFAQWTYFHILPCKQCDRLGEFLDFGQLFKAFGNN